MIPTEQEPAPKPAKVFLEKGLAPTPPPLSREASLSLAVHTRGALGGPPGVVGGGQLEKRDPRKPEARKPAKRSPKPAPKKPADEAPNPSVAGRYYPLPSAKVRTWFRALEGDEGLHHLQARLHLPEVLGAVESCVQRSLSAFLSSQRGRSLVLVGATARGEFVHDCLSTVLADLLEVAECGEGRVTGFIRLLSLRALGREARITFGFSRLGDSRASHLPLEAVEEEPVTDVERAIVTASLLHATPKHDSDTIQRALLLLAGGESQSAVALAVEARKATVGLWLSELVGLLREGTRFARSAEPPRVFAEEAKSRQVKRTDEEAKHRARFDCVFRVSTLAA